MARSIYLVLLYSIGGYCTPNVCNIGNFQVVQDDLHLFVGNKADEDKIVWQSVDGSPFISVGHGLTSQPPILNGNYQMEETIDMKTSKQTIDKVSCSNGVMTIGGTISNEDANFSANYVFTLSLSPLSTNQLQFTVTVDGDENLENDANRLFMTYWSDPLESFHGFGEAFTSFNLKGKRVPILVSEQGVGRGEQPITDYLNDQTEGVGGHWYTTYAPKPLYLTNQNRSMLFANSEVMYVDVTESGLVTAELWSLSMAGVIIYGDSMVSLVREITLQTGRMKKPPAWSQTGAVVGLEGGTQSVSDIVEKMKQAGVPISGVWLQDWVGLRHSYDGDRLIWNWEVNYEWYPGWQQMVDGWAADGSRVLTYLNPFFSDPSAFSNQSRHNFFLEGIDKGYFVKTAEGAPYKLYSLSIEFCMLDLTNPEAVLWMKSIISNYSLIEAQSSGWMADFGEYLPFDAVLHSGESAASYHNRYPEDWAKLTMETLTEQGRENDVLFFMRSAWLQSPKYNSIFWEGDQLVSWDSNDGLKNVVLGALSSGLSGHTISHSDIGGYNVAMYDEPGCTFLRTEELLSRWSELATFGAGLFRTHIGSSTTTLNFQVYDSDSSLAHFAEFASIYGALKAYRDSLIEVAITEGLPLIRPLAMHYSYDELAWSVEEGYLFGEDFLVYPCMEEGGSAVQVYFPQHSGPWVHLWGGNVVYGGKELLVPSPMGFPPVFYKQSSEWGAKLRAYVIVNGYTSGYTWDYTEESGGDSSSDHGDYTFRAVLITVVVVLGGVILVGYYKYTKSKRDSNDSHNEIKYASVRLIDPAAEGA